MDAILRAKWNEPESRWPRLVLDVEPGSQKQAAHFFTKLREWVRRDIEKAEKDKEPQRDRELAVHLEIFYQPRTLDQNRAYRGLLGILAFQRQGERGWEAMAHEEMLGRYGSFHRTPKGDPMATPDGRPIMKRSHEMSTVELSRLIEGVFVELALEGIPLEEASQYHNWWLEWRQWRGQLKDDPVAHDSVDEKRQATPYCEACLKTPPGVVLHMAHIVSEKASGLNEPWVFLHLCAEHHMGTQHHGGWLKLGREFPHLKPGIDQARKRSGAKELPWAA